MHILRDHRIVGAALLAGAVALAAAGCATRPIRPDTARPAKPTPPPSPLAAAPAKLLVVNTEHQFVVLDFSGRLVPPLGTRLTVSREGKPVGVVRVTGPVRGWTAVADILEGELRVGDEAR